MNDLQNASLQMLAAKGFCQFSAGRRAERLIKVHKRGSIGGWITFWRTKLPYGDRA
jgi:hypothetical protein